MTYWHDSYPTAYGNRLSYFQWGLWYIDKHWRRFARVEFDYGPSRLGFRVSFPVVQVRDKL